MCVIFVYFDTPNENYKTEHTILLLSSIIAVFYVNDILTISIASNGQ